MKEKFKMTSDTRKHIQKILNTWLMWLLLIIAIGMICLLVAMKLGMTRAKPNVNNSEAITTLSDNFGTTLVIPAIISEAKEFSYDNYRNILATIYADGNRFGFSEFIDVGACPLGVYITDNLIDEKYYIPNPEIESIVSQLDYIRIRITTEKSYISYKYDKLAYTLEINRKESLSEILRYIGANKDSLIETTPEKINEALGVAKNIEERENTSGNEYEIGKFYIPLDYSELGLDYGIDSDGAVSFYLDKRLVLKITDGDIDNSHSEVLHSSLNDSIKIVRYTQDFEINSPEYTIYVGLEMVVDSLKNKVNYIEE